MRIDRDSGTALVDYKTLRVGHLHINISNVAQQHRTTITPVQHHLAQFLDREGTGKAQRVTPLADIRSARRHILVGTCQLRHHGNLDTQAGCLVGIKGNAHFARPPATHLGPGHATDTLIAGLHHVLDKIQVGNDIALIARHRLDDEPGNCPAAHTQGTQYRFIGIIRVTSHPVQAIQYVNQRTLQVGTDGKGNRDTGTTTLCRGIHLCHALQATQYFFLRLDNFSLDFLRGRRTPAGVH